jgi:cellobiose-specific phosphotransferase system component IIA
MKKIVLIIILSFLLLSFGIQVFAQDIELPSPGLLPDSPFYFLETIAEAIGTFFTFGDLKKAERYAALAAERLAEAQAVVDKGKPEFAEKALVRYENQLNNSIARAKKAQDKGQNAEKVMEVIARVGQATSKHLEILAEVYEKVPDQAKPAIENAIKASVKGHEKAVEALKAKDALGEVQETISIPVEVPAEVRERIQTEAQQELEVEKIIEVIEDFDSSKSLRTFCIEEGGPPEMCDQFSLQRFESFEQLKAFCVESGGPPDTCASLEDTCREFGMTTAHECYLFLSISSIKAFTSNGLKVVPARSLSEEEMEEMRQRAEESRTLKLQTPEGAIKIPTEGLEEGIIEMPGE